MDKCYFRTKFIVTNARERDGIWKAIFSPFLLFVSSALLGMLIVPIQVLLDLRPSEYQFIPLGIFCGLYAMRPFRHHRVSWMFLVLLVTLHFALVHGFAYTKFIQQGASLSFHCSVGAIIGLMISSVALFARLIPDRQLKHEQPPK